MSRLRGLLQNFCRGGISFETRVTRVVLALIVISVLSANLSELRTMWQLDVQPGADEVSRQEKRFAQLKNALPQRGIVGFVTDAPDRSEQLKRRYIAGYALAPLVVAPGADRRLVIGDFADPSAARLVVGEALHVREDFGGGLVLFAAEER
jgi:hypothetical protein